MNRIVVTALFVLLMVGVAGVALLVRLTDPQNTTVPPARDLPDFTSVLEDDAPAPAEPSIEASDTDQTADRPETSEISVSDTRRKRDATSEATFDFTRLVIKTADDVAEACLAFSEDLDESGAVRYADYLRFEPAMKPALRVAGPLLCIGGLAFDKSYSVTIRKGLPAASGRSLDYDEVVPVQLRDRPAAIAFGSGIILPKDSADGIPVNTVNVSSVNLQVLLVGQRLLSQLGTGLLTQKILYPYDIFKLEKEQGRLVWEGSLSVSAQRNKTATTLFDFRDVVRNRTPGAYVILATNGDKKDGETGTGAKAAQWVIDTDLGLTTYQGNDGLRVFVRSLKSAALLERVEVTLIARNNTILASKKTSANGQVVFDPGLARGEGGARPAMLMAFGPGRDFTLLDLRRPALDLSDRGVSGRKSPGPLDAYLYLDRGIYRPGEQVHVVTMLRDRNAMVRDNEAPVTIVVRRPDGVEYRRMAMRQQKAGAAHARIALSDTAPRGRWSVSAYLDTQMPPVGRVTFDVQDFVPERLALELTADKKPLAPGAKINVEVAARFLYGAPAAGLTGEARLRLVRDPEPYAEYTDYSFGLANEAYTPKMRDLKITRTDTTGKAVVSGDLDPLPKTSFPLRADVSVSVFEPGGRSTKDRISLPVRLKPVSLGVRPRFEGSGVRQGGKAAFDVLALDRTGNRLALEKLDWRVVREIVNYHWYESNGTWRYEREVRDRPVDGGSIALTADKTAKLSTKLPVGTYRLAVTDPESGAQSSVRFWVGWADGEGDGRPDRVSVVADKPSYVVGETAKVKVTPATATKATLVVATDRIVHSEQIDIPAGGKTFEIDVTEKWGTGAYIIVNAYRPLKKDTSRAPVRSIGLAWAGIDHAQRIFDISLSPPEVAKPNSEIFIPVAVRARQGTLAASSAYVTLAAVDEGILQLTKFKSPNPERHYFGKRRLAIEMRDHYGQLIRNAIGTPGKLRFGGDALAAGGSLSVVPTKTVAIFSGIVPLDGNGRANIPVSLPDFAGELRLMATAFSVTGVGQGEASMTVRQDVVGELTLPRFLAPGDEADAILSAHNVSGEPGTYTAVLTLTGALGEETITRDIDLAADERTELRIPVKGQSIGIGSIGLSLSGPAAFTPARDWEIEVRPPQSQMSEQSSRQLAPGAELRLTGDELATFLPQTRSLSVSVSSSRGYNVPGLLAALDKYPYGCLEQNTSRAFPLLYFNDTALHSGIETDEDLKTRLQDAVDKVLDMQMNSGAFGMWGHGDSQAFEWISAFALEFLGQAKKKDYVVPTGAYRRGLRWLRQTSSANWRNIDSRAYAFYVLARAGEADISELRYFHDTDGTKAKNALTIALIASALHEAGDRARAKFSFDRAVEVVTKTPENTYANIQYGSQLRDLAGVTALVARADRTDLLPPLFEKMDELRRPLRLTTTQEKAWMLFAAHALGERRGELSLEITGMAAETDSRNDPVRFVPDEKTLANGVTIKNTGDKPVWVNLTAQGVPAAMLPASANGVTVSKRYRTPDGQPVNPASLAQNSRVVVVIEGQMKDNSFREMGLLDLLPAGWEIESVVPAGKKGGGVFPWMGTVTRTRTTASLDDRFVAAFDIGRRYRPRKPKKLVRPTFRIAYVARTTVIGTYVNPAVRVEDMYAPRVQALTAPTRLTVAGAQ